MAKTNIFKANNNQNITLLMNNTQETFCPHWIIRFTSDFVSDVSANAKLNIHTRDDLINTLVNAINETYKINLNVANYDFGAKHDRTNPKPLTIAKAQADVSNGAKIYIDAINKKVVEKLKSGQKVDYKLLEQAIMLKVPKEFLADVLKATKPKTNEVVFDF